MTLVQDVRYALRQLRKTPTFTITVLLTLALGIGANAAVFTLVNSLLLKTLPVTDPDSLVRFGNNNNCCVNTGVSRNGNYTLFSTEAYRQFRKGLPEFEDLAAMQAGFSYRPIIARRDGSQLARSSMGEFVSGNYFRTFGLQPSAGRLFLDSDDAPGAPMTVVMSYRTWQRDFAGDASVVGGNLWVNTRPVTVIGIAPEGFYGDRISITPPDFYLPLASMRLLENSAYVDQADVNYLYIIGRVKPGIATAALQEKVSALLRQAVAPQRFFTSTEGKALLGRVHVTLTPGGAGIRDMQARYSSNLNLLMWIAGLVLLIACANIANLLLVRGTGRRTEMSLRTALGATRVRIVRQLLTESVLLAGLGGLAGLVVAYTGSRMLLALAFPGAQNVSISASPSFMVIGFACALSLLTGVLFGVAPAWIASQAQPADALRSGARTVSSGASLLQRGLVVLQAALAVVLLAAAGLFSQSLGKLENTDMKLDTHNRYIVHINPQVAGYATTQLEQLYRTIELRFHDLPGVVNVGLAMYTPMEDNNWENDIQVQGQPNLNLSASFVRATPEYFDSVGTHVLMGRGISVQDSPTAPRVAVVNRSFVKNFFGDRNPIGARFGSPGPVSSGNFQIVGVVEDTAYSSVRRKNHSMYFLPMMQRPVNTTEPIENDLSLYAGAIVLQTDRPINDMASLAQQTLVRINPDLTVVKFQTFSEQIADRFNEERLVARLSMLFGALALALGTVGLYGVTAYTVARRTPEIGIRMALGAERLSVIAAVMRGAMAQVALGLTVGIPAAILCVRFVKSQLYEITSMDARVMAFAIVALVVAGCFAAMIPAQRAASIDPVKALRSE